MFLTGTTLDELADTLETGAGMSTEAQAALVTFLRLTARGQHHALLDDNDGSWQVLIPQRLHDPELRAMYLLGELLHSDLFASVDAIDVLSYWADRIAKENRAPDPTS